MALGPMRQPRMRRSRPAPCGHICPPRWRSSQHSDSVATTIPAISPVHRIIWDTVQANSPLCSSTSTTRAGMRLCGARIRSGNRCRKPARPGSARCHLHGAAGGRPRGRPEHPNSLATRLEGRRQWIERQRLAKAQGLIDKIPGGRKPGLRGRVRSPDPREARLERAAEKAIDMALKALHPSSAPAACPTVPANPSR